jgi:hypothetical protein
METSQQVPTGRESVRSHARGRRFWTVLIAPWPIAVVVGVAASVVFGFGLAIGIGSGLAIALGINFVWVVVVFAVDDGDVNDQVRASVERSARAGSPLAPRSERAGGPQRGR